MADTVAVRIVRGPRRVISRPVLNDVVLVSLEEYAETIALNWRMASLASDAGAFAELRRNVEFGQLVIDDDAGRPWEIRGAGVIAVGDEVFGRSLADRPDGEVPRYLYISVFGNRLRLNWSTGDWEDAGTGHP